MSLQEFLPTPRFEDYREFFKDFFTMERRDDGVLLARAHTRGGSVQLSVQNHRALGQFLKTVGADPENEVLILTGTGDDWMMGSDPHGFEIEEQNLDYWAYEYAYKDGRVNVSSLVNDLEIPTIGIFNGDGYHSEVLLMCDSPSWPSMRTCTTSTTASARCPATASTTRSRSCWASSAPHTRC